MSVADKQSEFGDPRNSFSAATFRKALKGLETGSLPYSEVQIELKRLLTGVSHRELRKVLRRSESIEPLPEYAHREVRRFLDEAIEQDMAPQTGPGDVREQEEELDPTALTAELQKSREALESERTRVRETEEALSERIVAEEAVRSRLGIALHESERHQAELRAARNSIASRDKLTAQIRHTLDERDAQLSTIRREHAELAAALELHSASGQQLNVELQVLRGQAADAATELASSREALDNERRRRQEVERTLTESNSLNSAARASLASKDKALAEMRQKIDERDAQLAAMRREHAELAAALDLHSASGQQLNVELQVLRGQAADTATELASSREALDSERRKRQEVERSLTEGNSLNSAARASLASKDKALAEMRQTIDERDAQLAAMRREYAELDAAFVSRSTSGEQLNVELQVLRGQAADAATELALSREALDNERCKRQEVERALTESNSLNSAARASLAPKDKALTEMRQTIDERDVQLAAMRRDYAELDAAFVSRSTSGEQLIAELQAAAAAELAASRDAADKERRKRQEIERALTESNSLNSAARASLASKDKALTEMRQTIDERDAQLVAQQRELRAALQASEEKLQSAQGRVVGANTDLDGFRTQIADLQAKLRVNNELVEKLYASVRSEAERATQWQAAAQQRESEPRVTSARVEVMPQVDVLPRAQTAQASAALAKFRSAVRWRLSIRTMPRQIWIGAVIVLLATATWFAAHRRSPMQSSPAVSTAAMIEPATTALATESVEPQSVSTENVSAIKAPPQGVATLATGKSVTAAVTLNTDFRRCRAGEIDACYDAIRYRPSDPSLLSALGDALLRAHRPADALRAYQRVAILAPNMPGVVAKISTIEAKLSAMRASGSGSTHAVDVMRNSNATSQTHRRETVTPTVVQ